MRGEAYEKGFDDGFEFGFKEGEEATMTDIARGIFNVEKYGFTYPKCPYCKKPLTSVIARKDSKMGMWVLEKIREEGWHHAKCEKDRFDA